MVVKSCGKMQNDTENESYKNISESGTNEDGENAEDTPKNPMVLVPGGYLLQAKPSWRKFLKDSVFPQDPAEWNAQHIESWLEWTTREFQIDPPPQTVRFPTTGQELVSLSRADFWVCAGSKLGGNLLAKHIAHLIQSSTGRSQSPLLSDEDPGEYPICFAQNNCKGYESLGQSQGLAMTRFSGY